MVPLMHIESPSPCSQPFPTGDGISGFGTKQFLQINVCYAVREEWSCWLSKQGGIDLASSFPCLDE